MSKKPMMILIAGPYRSGTGDDPAKMEANLKRLEVASWPIFQKGHVPMIGEWVALPVWHTAGGKAVGDDLYDRVLHPTAGRLLQHSGLFRHCGGSRSCMRGLRRPADFMLGSSQKREISSCVLDYESCLLAWR